jgi:three-Cys-motif partner protein
MTSRERTKIKNGKLTQLNDTQPDPCPTLLSERGPKGKGVGIWVPKEKHRLLHDYLFASRNAWRKWPQRVYIDPFSGPGRVQVEGEQFTRDGGALVAWRTLREAAPFTKVLVGDLVAERAEACGMRLEALGAPVEVFVGAAVDTVPRMIRVVPSRALCMAFLDPYNLELLSYSMIQHLAKLKVDLAINFSTMDLERNGDLEFNPDRARFDDAAPGWRDAPQIKNASKQNLALAFFEYWCSLVRDLGFESSKAMPLVQNNHGRSIYRIVFFARHDLPKRIWGDVARERNRSLFDE